MQSIANKYNANEILLNITGGEPLVRKDLFEVMKFAIPIILFIIGVFVILSKKITKKTKAIVISTLVVLAIFGVILMEYISKNFYNN